MSTLVVQLDELGLLLEQRKHLPGMHDQKTHTPQSLLGRAAVASMTAGAPVTVDWLSQEPQERLFNELQFLDATKAKLALVAAKVTREDMVGLKRVTSRPFEGYTYDHQGVLHNRRGQPCTGSYQDGTICISTHRFLDSPSVVASTMRHEMGHHKFYQMKLRNISKLRDARQVIDRAGLKRFNDTQLSNAGLRMYSISSPKEFLADTYMVMGMGTPEQKKLLSNIWSEAGYTDLEAIYKHLTGVVYVNEIRAVTYDDGSADFIEVPVVIQQAIYEETPWYYANAD